MNYPGGAPHYNDRILYALHIPQYSIYGDHFPSVGIGTGLLHIVQFIFTLKFNYKNKKQD